MFVLHISTTDIEGGAARAAFRLNQSLNNNKNLDIKSSLLVLRKFSDDKNVFAACSKFGSYKSKIKNFLAVKIQKLQSTNNKVLHSSAIFSSNILKIINDSKADIIHLHWIQGEMISVEDIGKIEKKVIWTFHDTWPFCGSEHYPNGLDDERYMQGYLRKNRGKDHFGIDLDKLVWDRKNRNWTKKYSIVCPSNWMRSCVIKSKLMSDWPVYKIPHALPINIFKPLPKILSRELFNLPKNKKLILFGALNATNDKRKGWDLLKLALNKISKELPSLEAVVFGASEPNISPNLGMNINYVGRIYDDQTLALLYSAADIMVVPSYMESFGQTASEAQACGLPVVAFKSTGLKDIISHKNTGYLAKPYYWEDIYAGIKWILDNYMDIDFKSLARKRAEKLWSPEVISKKYSLIYRELVK